MKILAKNIFCYEVCCYVCFRHAYLVASTSIAMHIFCHEYLLMREETEEEEEDEEDKDEDETRQRIQIKKQNIILRMWGIKERHCTTHQQINIRFGPNVFIQFRSWDKIPQREFEARLYGSKRNTRYKPKPNTPLANVNNLISHKSKDATTRVCKPE